MATGQNLPSRVEHHLYTDPNGASGDHTHELNFADRAVELRGARHSTAPRQALKRPEP